jgi:hypothetical protein
MEARIRADDHGPELNINHGIPLESNETRHRQLKKTMDFTLDATDAFPEPPQSELDRTLTQFWTRQLNGATTSDANTKYRLPVARIKRVMRTDDDVKPLVGCQRSE